MEKIISKKIKEKNIDLTTKYSAVYRFFLNNPKYFELFMKKLYIANVLSHMMDSVMEDFNSFGKYMIDQSTKQKMSNANKAFDKLVDGLYKNTLQLGVNAETYSVVTDLAYSFQTLFEDIIYYIVWEGKDNFRYRELEKKLKELIPPTYKEQISENFKKMTRETNKDIYESIEKDHPSEDKKKIYDAIEHMLVGKYFKEVC